MWLNVVGVLSGAVAQLPLSSKLGTPGTPFVWAEYTFVEPSLVAAGRSVGGIYPGQPAARTGCDH